MKRILTESLLASCWKWWGRIWTAFCLVFSGVAFVLRAPLPWLGSWSWPLWALCWGLFVLQLPYWWNRA